MKTLNIHEFKCIQCGMPSVPGTCELCRVRVAMNQEPHPGPYLLLGAIMLICLAVLIASFTFAANI